MSLSTAAHAARGQLFGIGIPNNTTTPQAELELELVLGLMELAV